jgi:hypothetical protein
MKLSIRDLFLVTVIVALAVAWWVERTERSKLTSRVDEIALEYRGMETRGDRILGRYKELQRMITAKGWVVDIGGLDVDGGSVRDVRPPINSSPAPNPPKP